MLARRRERERGRIQDRGATGITGIGIGITGRRLGLRKASGLDRRKPITMDMKPPPPPTLRVETPFTQSPAAPPPPPPPPPTSPTTRPLFRTNRKQQSRSMELRPAARRMHQASHTVPMQTRTMAEVWGPIDSADPFAGANLRQQPRQRTLMSTRAIAMRNPSLLTKDTEFIVATPPIQGPLPPRIRQWTNRVPLITTPSLVRTPAVSGRDSY